MYDIFVKEILYNAYEKCNQILGNKYGYNLIKKSISIQNVDANLIVFIVGKYDLISCRVTTLKKTSQPYHIKRYPTIREHGEIRDVCFNSSGNNIYVLFEKGIIIRLPLSNEHEADLTANLIFTESICSPTNLIVYLFESERQEIAIISNDLGELCFVNIERKKLIRKTNIKKSIRNLRIIRDKFTVTLLITATDNSQFKLPLAEHPSKILNKDADYIKFMEENSLKLFSRFLSLKDNRNYLSEFLKESEDADKISISADKMNIKPIQILNNKDCILTYQDLFVLATYHQENVKSLVSINIYNSNDFNYEFTTPSRKYCFPKECVSLDHSIVELVTNRLIITANNNVLFIISKQCSDFRREKSIDNNSKAIISWIEFEGKILNAFRMDEVWRVVDSGLYFDSLIVVTSHCVYKLKPKMSCEKIFTELIVSNKYQAHEFAFMTRLNLNTLYRLSTHHFLENKQYQKVLELFTSDNISKFDLIRNFLFYGYLNEAISLINHLFDEKNYDLDDRDKVSFANVYVACSVQRIMEKKVLENEKNVSNLKRFLITNIYYNERYVIKLLISSYMFSLAKLCARIRNNYSCLISNLLNIEQVQRELLGDDHTEANCDTREKNDAIYDKIIKQTIYPDVLLIEPFRSKDYFKCILARDILQGFFVEANLISTYLKLLIDKLPELDNKLLKRVSRIFDPRQPQVQIMLNNIINNGSKKYMHDEGDQSSTIIQKKDVINFFIHVNLIMLKNQNLNSQFDERILWNKTKLAACHSDLDLNQSSFEQDFMLSAGQSRGFLIKHGNLFSWGSGNYGADADVNIISTGSTKTFEPKLNTYFADLLAIEVIGVSSGAHHTLILTKISCYAVGQSIYGQLGCGNKIQYTKYPKIIKRLQHLTVQKLVCGQYHSFALTTNGRLYSWGWAAHGQLGIPSFHADCHGDTENLYEPKLIKYFKDKNIVDVCAGYCHSLVLDSDGLVYSFGSNVFGQLGCQSKSKLKKRNLPEPIYLIDDKINLIASKYFQCLAYSMDSKTLYYFGTSPQNNQLMAQQLKKMRNNPENSQQPQNCVIHSNDEHHTPRKLKLEEFEVKKLETGNLHCMLLTTDGKVYSWGRGSEGQMGHGSEKSIVLPTMIKSLDTTIVDIACGYDFSLCVDSDGELYGFGQNNDHQLGFITKFEQSKVLNDVNNLLENTKKVLLKSKKVLNMLSSKQVEKVPVRVEFGGANSKKLSYLDSMSIDFGVKNRRKEKNKQEKLELLNFEKADVRTQHLVNFDLCVIISRLRHELDLHVLLDKCLLFDSYLCCGFIYELLKEPLNAIDFYMKAAYSSIEQIKRILEYFITRTMTTNSAIFKQLMIKFITNWLDKYEISELEIFLTEIYDEKVNSFLFGLFLFELMDSDELKKLSSDNEIAFSNQFKIKLMKTTCKYLKSAKFNEFNYEPASSLLSSIRDDHNLLSAEKLWKNILSNIQKDLDYKKSNGKSTVDEETSEMEDSYEDSSEGVEVVPEDNQIYIFGSNYHKIDKSSEK